MQRSMRQGKCSRPGVGIFGAAPGDTKTMMNAWLAHKHLVGTDGDITLGIGNASASISRQVTHACQTPRVPCQVSCRTTQATQTLWPPKTATCSSSTPLRAALRVCVWTFRNTCHAAGGDGAGGHASGEHGCGHRCPSASGPKCMGNVGFREEIQDRIRIGL